MQYWFDCNIVARDMLICPSSETFQSCFLLIWFSSVQNYFLCILFLSTDIVIMHFVSFYRYIDYAGCVVCKKERGRCCVLGSC
jgi:hypothetical protein